LLEGVAVYLEAAVLESVLDQFRQVAAPGSQLAISVSTAKPADDESRARFQAVVAALGEPVRSAFAAGQAQALLARTGWPPADGGGAGAGGGRAGAPGGRGEGGPPAASASVRPDCSRRPSAPGRRGGPGARPCPVPLRPSRPEKNRCPCRPCCPRRWSRSRSS